MLRPTEDHDDPLPIAFNFSPQDLVDNQAGVLSERQRRRLLGKLQFGLFVGAALSLLLAGFGFWLIGEQSYIFAGIMLAFAVGVWWFGRSGRERFTQEIRNGKVMSVRGEVELSTQDYNSARSKITEYRVQVGDEVFVVTQAEFFALEDGDKYTLHFLPGMRIILSAERG